MAAPSSSTLPVEIWLQIFSLATLVPGALDTKDQNAITAFTKDNYGILAQAHYRRTIDTKHAISLVCRSWHALIFRNLLEYVVIGSGRQVLRVAELLDAKPAYGHRTARLEIALEGIHIWDREHSLAITSIIRACPNISVFSTIFSTTDAYFLFSSGILSALATTIYRERPIRRLELRADIPIIAALLCVLSPSLEVLWVQPSRRVSTCLVPYNIELPKLHTCISSFPESNIFRTAYMPSVNTFLTQDELARDDVLRRCGETVKHISAQSLKTSAVSLALCPKLEMLSVSCADRVLSILPPLGLIHPNVSTLTLEHPDFFRQLCYHREDLSLFPLAHLERTLRTLTSGEVFPSLRRLRFVLPSLLTSTRLNYGRASKATVSVWEEWMDSCRDRGIRVEIAEGSDGMFHNTWSPLTKNILIVHLHAQSFVV
ncbi:hypothetical protein PC9H_000991 [Pleurotus ostreatus]|uniref:F-box domain-containing protein n=1 Tax=Pleurotus ostreatus TaxID=5322 RepID=A0A8H7DVT1_PLEOS|nr:uncharacterized protein PC9H_000991 [Pleurotus ostreatus]KAF7440644.1 hypothetical protein PC9H_000991 [Pleurotus ostreatus]KAJ8699973.1 hypothetical protein PTI98_003046 [Pleurotus ostreatus]